LFQNRRFMIRTTQTNAGNPNESVTALHRSSDVLPYRWIQRKPALKIPTRPQHFLILGASERDVFQTNGKSSQWSGARFRSQSCTECLKNSRPYLDPKPSEMTRHGDEPLIKCGGLRELGAFPAMLRYNHICILLVPRKNYKQSPATARSARTCLL